MTESIHAKSLYLNAYKTSCLVKHIVKAPNIHIGDYTYYDDDEDPTLFEERNILFNYPEFQEQLIIGKFCSLAKGVRFMMGAANHRMSSVSTYPFAVCEGAWGQAASPHMDQLPHKGDTVIGNDVWIGREAIIMPGVHIGDGAIIGAFAVVASDVPAYHVAVGNPARVIKKRFDDELIQLLEAFAWWDLPEEKITDWIPLLCDPDLEKVKEKLKKALK